MKKARTILAIMLALVMVLSVLPASFADNAKKDAIGKLGERQGETTPTLERRGGSKLQTNDLRNVKSNSAIDPEAEVTAIVIFEEPALSDSFTAEEIRAKKADSVQQRMSSAHDVFFKSLDFEAKRMYDYTALINGMSLKTAYKNLSAMEKMAGVSKVYVANEFNAPVVEQPAQMNANLTTGAAYLQDVLYKGDGMVAAVLDTGLNYEHEAFQDYGVLENPAFTEEYVASVDTTVPGKYISEKIPFSYDYYDDDDDVMDYNGHGTHVSGTVAGYALDADGAVKFSGAAPHAQLVFMKIFADQSSGTNSGIYMAALEDCFLLGVDTINMSIGSPAGFTYDEELEDSVFGNVYKKLDMAGVVVCVAAGNEYSLAHVPGNFAGEGYVLPELADYAQVASPSTYDGNISVASLENFAYPSLAMEYDGVAFPYTDNCSDGEHGWLDTFGGQTLELVDCGYGREGEFPAEVAGKIALVSRGDITFSEKNANAAAAGAIGMILYNNQSGTIGMLIDEYFVPAVSITQAAGEMILVGLATDNTVTVGLEQQEVENPSAWLMSGFSNWGPTPNLELKPTITAPGGMIYSAVNGGTDVYEVYSGTSMATPNSCGSFTLLLQYLKENYPQLSKRQRAELAEDLAKSTAWVPMDADGYPYSPRKSGSGVIAIDYAIASPVYVIDPIVNLGDDPDKEGVYTIRYTLVNLSDNDLEYEAYVATLYDWVNGRGYNTLTSDWLDENYGGITVSGDVLVTVPANGMVDGTITIELDDAIKEEFDATFENGTYVEGYIFFTNVSGEGMEIPTIIGVLGDANLDGKVTAADAAEILRAVVGLTELSADAAVLADLDKDGEVTSLDAAFLLRAVVGIEELPDYIVPIDQGAPEIHITYLGFYGDWTQGPVIDRVWTNDPTFLFYFAAENIIYPEYLAQGYLPTDLFNPLETNIGPSWVYGYAFWNDGAISYFGANPITTLVSNEDIIAEAWYEYFMNDQYNNPLHNAISNYNGYYEGTADDYYVDGFYSMPIQLRNAKHLIMTVMDANTGEIYYVDDTENLGKAYFDTDSSTWTPRGSFAWDGIVTNEESALYGDYVPNGTLCYVLYETMVDYPGAELNLEYGFELLVDTEAPVIVGMDIEEIAGDQEVDPETGEPMGTEDQRILHVYFDDNGSGMSFAEAYYYDNALDGYSLDWTVGDGCYDFAIDITEVPEDVNFICFDALDYATNFGEYVLNIKTGELETDEFGTIAMAVNKILNGEMLGEVVPVEGIITDIYNGTLYVAAPFPSSYDEPLGMAIELADPDDLEDVKVGDAYVFAGELDSYYGLPRLVNAEITYDEYINEYDDYGDIIWYYMMLDGLTFDYYFYEIAPDPTMFLGYVFYLDTYYDGIVVTEVTECGDGTRTITISDGTYTYDIVGVTVGENTFVGDTIEGAYLIPVMDHGVFQFRALCGGDYSCLEFGSDYDY